MTRAIIIMVLAALNAVVWTAVAVRFLGFGDAERIVVGFCVFMLSVCFMALVGED